MGKVFLVATYVIASVLQLLTLDDLAGRVSIVIMKCLRSAIFSSRPPVIIAATVALLFLCLLPFASALEVHHIFAEVDHDGHEHSDFDLCQWVQAHGSGSIDLDYSGISAPILVDHERWPTLEIVFSSVTLTSCESRGPPLFL